MGHLDASLAFSALLMGLAGVPHCAAMCGAACSTLTRANAGARPWQAMLAWQLGRLFAYAAVGAAVAGSVSWLARWGSEAAWLRPLWGMVHVAALALGLWLLWRGRQPAWLEELGRPQRQPEGVAVLRFQSIRGPARAGLLGSLWVAWPCGLLQSALLVAALASSPSGGAAVMALFATGSGLGLWMGLVYGARLWARVVGTGNAVAIGWQTLAVRLAGVTLAAVSGWALWHGLAEQIAALCA